MFVVCLRPSGQTLAGMYKNPTPWDGKLSPPFQVYIFYSSQSWISGKHTAFWSYEMMAHHNSLSSCPYTCPRCAIKQVNQVETDFMIQKEKIDLQEVMARRPGKGLDDSSEFVCSISLSLSPCGFWSSIISIYAKLYSPTNGQKNFYPISSVPGLVIIVLTTSFKTPK